MAAVRVLEPVHGSKLSRLVDDYLTSCRARGLSPRTVDIAYGYSLRSVFLPWCVQERIDAPHQLDQRTLDRFTTSLLTAGGKRGARLSKHSVHTYVRGVRQFLSWAAKEGEDVDAKPQLPKLSKRHRDVLSRREIDRLEAVAIVERDRIIIRVFSDCGLRLGELTGLRAVDILRSGNQAHFRVIGKGDRERRVPIPPRLLRRLERYIEDRPAEATTNQLFVSLRRDPAGDYDRLTESGVSQLVYVAGVRAGLRQAVRPHLLRHSWMTELLRQGVNPIQLSVIAGSSQKVIADHYEHLTQDDAYASMIRALSVERKP